MGVKNNFSQAVSELIGISRVVEPEQDKSGLEDDKAEAESKLEASQELNEADAEELAEIEEEKEESSEQRDSTVFKTGQNPKERIMAMLAQQQASQPQPQEVQQASQPQSQEAQQSSQPQGQEKDQQEQPQIQQQEEPQMQPQMQQAQPQIQRQQPSQEPKEAPGLTTIARGTVIIGEINADGDVELLGSVKGKIASKGDIKANGKVVGDLIGRDIDLVACAVQGNIIASGAVSVDENSVVIGDVKGENFCLDGKIKGNVTVEHEAKFQPKAILAGNVTTASIAMSQGAKIQGEVNIPLSEKETDMTFDVDIKI